MQPDPALAGVSSGPSSGPAARLRRVARAALDATVAPRTFFRRWADEPARYPDPGELLALNAALVGIVTWFATEFLELPGGGLRAVAGESRWAGRVAGGFEAAFPAAVVYGQVLSTWAAARLTGGAPGWAVAQRLAGFLSAVYLPVTVLSVALAAAWPAAAGAGALASLGVDLGYGAVGFAALHAMKAGRAVASSTLTLVATLVVYVALLAAGGAAVGFTRVLLP